MTPNSSQTYRNVLLLSVDELWLKGSNQHLYSRQLLTHIRKVVKELNFPKTEVIKQNERYLVKLGQPLKESQLVKFQQIAGINRVIPAACFPLDYSAFLRHLPSFVFPSIKQHQSFAINSRRANKGFAVKSDQINRDAGAAVWQTNQNLKVDLTKPDLEVFIRVLNDGIYVYCEKFPGLGGLPVGSSGRLLSLLSGGIDSPVANILMTKRGCAQDMVFFYAYPFVGEEVKTKIIKLAKIISQYQLRSHLHIVAMGNLQQEIVKSCLAPYRTVLFRIFMLKIAAKIASLEHLGGLVTGDSLGQVSSQTLQNLTVVDRIVSQSIFRPLIGLNKSEIIQLAQRFGTYETSIEPHDDACSLLAPKNPVIHADALYLEDFLRNNNFDSLINLAVQTREIIKL